MKKQRLSQIGTAVACMALCILFLRNAIRPGVSYALGQDNEFFIGPVLSSISAAFTNGVWPLRMDTALGGLPLYNFPQLSPFYPLYFGWLKLFDGPLQTAQTMHWITLLHVLIGQVTMFLLLRAMGVSRAASVFGGALFAFNANSAGYAGWINITAPYAWFPLYVAGLVGILREPNRLVPRLTAGLGIVMLTLASPAQPLIHAVFVSVVFLIANFLHQERHLRWPHIRRAILYITLVGITVLLIAAPVIGPATLELKNSIRWIGPFPPVIGHASIPFEAFQMDQLSLQDIGGTIFRFADPAVGSPYVGLVVLTLAIIGWVSSPRGWLISAFGFIALYAILSSTGINLGFAYLNYVVPLLNKIREPSRFLVLFQFAIAALAALGIDRIRQMSAQGVFYPVGWVVGSVVGIAALLVPFATKHSVSATSPGVSVALVCALGLFTWLATKPANRPWQTSVAWTWMACALLLLGVEVRWNPPSVDQSLYATAGGAQRDALFARLSKLDPAREYRVLFDGDIDKQVFAMHASYSGIRTLNAYFNPAPYRQFEELYYHGPRSKNYFQNLGAKFLVCKNCRGEALVDYHFLESVVGFDIYQADSVQPYIRAYTSADGVFSSLNDFADQLSRAGKAGDSLIVQSGIEAPVPKSPIESSGMPCKVSIVQRSVDGITAEATCTVPSILQLNEYFDLAWQAEVDGHSKDVWKVNGVLLGTAIPPGTHVVRFRYAPVNFYYLLPLGALGILLTAFAVARSRRKTTQPSISSSVLRDNLQSKSI